MTLLLSLLLLGALAYVSFVVWRIRRARIMPRPVRFVEQHPGPTLQSLGGVALEADDRLRALRFAPIVCLESAGESPPFRAVYYVREDDQSVASLLIVRQRAVVALTQYFAEGGAVTLTNSAFGSVAPAVPGYAEYRLAAVSDPVRLWPAFDALRARDGRYADRSPNEKELAALVVRHCEATAQAAVEARWWRVSTDGRAYQPTVRGVVRIIDAGAPIVRRLSARRDAARVRALIGAELADVAR